MGNSVRLRSAFREVERFMSRFSGRTLYFYCHMARNKYTRRKNDTVDYKLASSLQESLATDDLLQIRRLSSAVGLGTSGRDPARGQEPKSLRTRCWLHLAGCTDSESSAADSTGLDGSAIEQLASQALDRDAGVIEVDVARSLWGWASDADRPALRSQLKAVLKATCASYPDGSVYYYQGMHDVAAVLLLTCGEAAALRILARLSVTRLRDFTRRSLDPAARCLTLLDPLLAQVDPELSAHVQESGAEPIYALSWLLCWFAHDISSLPELRRLFDLFLASHPLMPLYVAAAMATRQRARLLATDRTDPAEVHHAMSAVPKNNRAAAHDLCLEAISLFRRHPPESLAALLPGASLWGVASMQARLEDGRWHFPPPDWAPPPQADPPAAWGKRSGPRGRGMGRGRALVPRGVALRRLATSAATVLSWGATWGLLAYTVGVAVVSPSVARPDLNPVDDALRVVLAGVMGVSGAGPGWGGGRGPTG